MMVQVQKHLVPIIDETAKVCSNIFEANDPIFPGSDAEGVPSLTIRRMFSCR